MFLTPIWLWALECQEISGLAIDVPLPFSFSLFIPHTTSPEISLFAAFQAAVSWLQAIWLAALQKKVWKAGGIAANHYSAALHHTGSGFHLPDSPAKRIIML